MATTLPLQEPTQGRPTTLPPRQAALLSATRRVTTREERQVLEAEVRQRIQITETGGTPGRPGTPDSFNTVTIREGSLDPQALTDLQGLIDNLRNAGSGPPSRFIPLLAEELEGRLHAAPRAQPRRLARAGRAGKSE